MKKHNCNKLLFTLCLLLTFTACNIAGLDLQQDVKYNATPLQPNLNKSAYEFIQSRKSIDMFIMATAIDRAGYRDSFELSNRTFIVMNDIAFSSYIKSKNLVDVNLASLVELKKILNKLTILGVYTSLDLTLTPIVVQTADPATTLLLTLKPLTQADDANKYIVRIADNKIPLPNSPYKEVVTSNLKATNGIIHVLEQQLY
jgi:hypothetical protein